MDLKDVLLDLEILNQINEGDKLSVAVIPGEKKLFVDKNGYLTPASRWYNGYNREDSINYLEELMSKIEKAGNTIVTGNHEEDGVVLINAIKKGIFGLNNLKQTYINDSIIVAKLVLLINNMNTIIKKLENENLSDITYSMITSIENDNKIENNKSSLVDNKLDNDNKVDSDNKNEKKSKNRNKD